MKIPDAVVATMARAGYEHSRQGRSLPPWEDATRYWKTQAHEEMRAAVSAAIEAGHIKLLVVG